VSAKTARTSRKARGAGNAAPFTVFLDRDGVFNVHPKLQVRRWEQFHWLAGVREAFARLNRPGIRTCLITNQPGTGFGLSTKAMVERVHANMMEELAAAGGRLDRVEVCYVPAPIPSRHRKPRPGMLEDAAVAFAEAGEPVLRGRAVMVGDKIKDAQAAAAFGIPCILLGTTTPKEQLADVAMRKRVPYAAIVDGLPDAVELILAWVAEGENG
jgi:D-glycero-D-manno-heptose 1,7-bisphosphate phosphatase